MKVVRDESNTNKMPSEYCGKSFALNTRWKREDKVAVAAADAFLRLLLDRHLSL